MTIEWHTKNINIQNYYKIIRRTIIFNSSYAYWKQFKKEWTVHVIPVEDSLNYRHFFNHLNIEKSTVVSTRMAWGITGMKEMFLFVVDSRNPFIIRSNIMPISHELLHAIYQDNVGTFHVIRRYDSPDGRAGTKGAAATVIVHDNWYGRKMDFTFWISWGIGWLPIKITYMPLFIARQLYPI